MSRDQSSPSPIDNPVAAMAAALAEAAQDGGAAAADDDQDPTAALHGLLARLTGHHAASFGEFSRFSSGGRYKSLLDDLQCTDDEFRQESGLRKLCETLLMGNEETLGGFRPDQFVPVLHDLLQCDYRPQVALLACDALCNMLEAMPQSSPVVAQCASSLCAKLLSIEYIDLAERALTTLSKLSVEQGKAILQAGGLNSVLAFLDFFPIAIQRSAMQTAANVCCFAGSADISLVKDAVPQLSNLLQYADRVLVEAACDCFGKLVNNFRNSSEHLQLLADHGLIPKMAGLLSASPRLIGKKSVSLVLSVLAGVIQACPTLVGILHESDIVGVAVGLLGHSPAGVTDRSANSSRAQSAGSGTRLNSSPEQLCDVMDLLFELLPPLPKDVLVSVMPTMDETKIMWQWRDNEQRWRNYQSSEAKILERAYNSGEKSANFRMHGQHYSVNFEDMVQMNRVTRVSRPVKRLDKSESSAESDPESDPRTVYLTENAGVLEQFCEPLVAPLFDVFLSTANLNLKLKTIMVIVKMLHHATPSLLEECLRSLAISSYLTNILRKESGKLVVAALQIAQDLVKKLPAIFSVTFRRQGVLFEVCRLSSPQLKSGRGKSKITLPKSPEAGASSSKVRVEYLKAMEKFVCKASRNILEEHFDESLVEKRPLDDMHPAMDLTRRLHGLANEIDPEKEQKFGNLRAKEALSNIAVLLADEEASISSFELWSSGMIPALLRYLTLPTSTESKHTRLDRIRTFLKLFFVHNADDELMHNEALNVLVKSIQGAINLTESFPRGAGTNNDAFIENLKHPIRLKLEPEKGSSFKELSSHLVMIEPFASINAIEEFLWPRVRQSDRARQRGGAAAAAAAAAAPEDAAEESESMTENPENERDMDQHSVEDFEEGRHIEDDDDEDEEDEDEEDEDEDDEDDKDADDEDGDRSRDSEGAGRRRSRLVDLSSLAEDDATDDVDFAAAASAQASSGTHRKVQVLMNGLVLDSTSTIFEAIREHDPSSVRGSVGLGRFGGHRMGGKVYCITYREAPPPTAPAHDFSDQSRSTSDATGASKIHPLEALLELPKMISLDIHDDLYASLALLRVLFVLNESGDMVGGTQILHPSEFVNNSIASKITREVSDLESICSASFPGWCRELVTTCPFIVPFECKSLFFFYTAFGSVRALVYFQQVNNIPEVDSAGERTLPTRVSRIKIKVSRRHILRSLSHMVPSFTNSKAIVEVIFKGEIGTGLGPTQEFYALASQAWQQRKLGMWRDDSYDATEASDVAASNHVFSTGGLYPSPRPATLSETEIVSRLGLFKLLGTFIARAMLDSRMLDLPLSVCFMTWLLGYESQLGLAELRIVDEKLWQSINKLDDIARRHAAIVADSDISSAERDTMMADLKVDGCSIDDLCLTFELPGYPGVALKEDGAETSVTLETLGEYVDLVVRHTLIDSVQNEMRAVREGFAEVFPYDTLKLFSAGELTKVLRGSDPLVWEKEELKRILNADHGYNSDSPQVDYLSQVLSEFDREEQRLFLAFITGCPNLPVGGFKALRPPLTVVRKSVPCPDDELPSVMTCQNYLKLPPYTSVETLAARLKLAMREGQGSFALS